MPADTLKNLLNPSQNTELADVVARARKMGALTGTLARALPDGLADGLVAANVRTGGELVVIARSPAWAAKLRFEGERLRTAAIDAGEQVGNVSVRVSHDV